MYINSGCYAVEDLKIRISKIEERNKRVEEDKAWEISKTRIIIIITLTYVFATLYLKVADSTNPFFGALIPTVGYLLSNLSLKHIKKIWLNRYKK